MNTFPTEFWSDFSNPQNFIGHVAYVLLIISMMMRNMNWLRFFAILAGSISAVFYFTIRDFVSMFWESMFTLVNLAQYLILQVENRRGKFSEEESAFIEKCLPSIERAQARRFMRLGTWTEVQADMLLIEQDTCPKKLFYLIDGEAIAEHDGKIVGRLNRGDFFGEMSYLTGETATASVKTILQCRFLAFDRNLLRDHLNKHPEVKHALEASFNRNLVNKLAESNKKNVGQGAK